MKQILTIIALLISLSSYGQLVRIDSTWSSKRMYHTNHIGYRIGSDSIRTKDVRATLDGGDTFHIITDSLVSRIVYRFITTDSLSPYLKTVDFDEKAEDIIGTKLIEGSNITLTYNDATGETTIDASGGGGGGLTDEQVRDTTVAMFTVGPSITWNEDDAADSVYLDVNTNPLESAVQGLLIGKSLGFAIASFNSMSTMGMQFTTTGAATGTTISSSSPYRARPHKYEYVVSTASTSAVAGYRGQGDEVRQDDGFVYSITWGPVLGVSNTSKRAFAGLRNSPSSPTDVSPTTLVECFGMGWDDANDTNIQIFHNDNSGTATQIDLGSGFPIPTADRTDFYTLYIYVPKGGAGYYYKVVDESDGTSTTGLVTTDLVASSSFMRPFNYTSVGGVSAQTGIGIFTIYRLIP